MILSNKNRFWFYFVLMILLIFQFNLFSQEPTNNQTNKIIIIGDTQHIGFWESLYWDYWNEHNADKTKLLFNEIANRKPEFILHLGDITKDGSDEDAWKEFDQDSRLAKQKKILCYPAFGNHEYFGSADDMYKYFYMRFPNVKNKKYYSFISRQIGFIITNSNFDEFTDKENADQRNWYLNQLKDMDSNPEVKIIIVVSHHPPFTNSTIVSPSSEVEEYFAKPFIKSSKGMFFFSGHCHSYERFERNDKFFIVSGGGGGPRQKLEIDKKERAYNDLFNGPAIRFFHFCQIETYKDSVMLQVVKLNENKTFSIAEKIVVPFHDEKK